MTPLNLASFYGKLEVAHKVAQVLLDQTAKVDAVTARVRYHCSEYRTKNTNLKDVNVQHGDLTPLRITRLHVKSSVTSCVLSYFLGSSCSHGTLRTDFQYFYFYLVCRPEANSMSTGTPSSSRSYACIYKTWP